MANVYSARRVLRFRSFLAQASRSARKPVMSKPNAFIKDKLGRIETGISQLIEAQRQEFSHLKDIDEKIMTDVQTAREEMASLQADVKKLEDRLGALKDLPEEQANSLKRRISRMKTTIESINPVVIK
jgi:septation ring formation regulator EzrA